jgi:carboxyl-terminal processing protease
MTYVRRRLGCRVTCAPRPTIAGRPSHPLLPHRAMTAFARTAQPPRARRILCTLTALAAALALASCGGGGGDDDGIPPSVAFEGQQRAGTSGINVSDWVAASCTDSRQKNWVRANLNEDYLFYRDAPLQSIIPDAFDGPVADLFDAYTVNALPDLDRFSFVITQAEADATFQEGSATGIGVGLRRDPVTQQIRIAFVDPAGPAAPAGLRRGMLLQSVNGTPLGVQNGVPVLSIAQSNALFASAAGTPVTVGFTTPPSAVVQTFALTTATFAETPVLATEVFDNPAVPGAKVGYIAHTSFALPIAEVDLADAFADFQASNVTDLVVDLRYNGGGFLFMASQLAYMVAGNNRTDGKTFETLVFNDKRSGENTAEPFATRIRPEFNPSRANEPLPQLSLSRVFLLTTGSTCSASEAFASALRGVDVQVITIGSTTCGKPYGFSQENNCALAYFPLEFEGRNHKGEVVPVTGITPTCAATDDLDHELADPAEGMLASALGFVQTGACPAAATARARALAQPRQAGAPVAELEFTQPHRAVQLRIK